MGQVIPILKFIPGVADLALKILPYKMSKKNHTSEENRRRANDIAKKHAEYILKITNTEVRIQGESNIPAGTPKIFMGNHQSYFDVLVELCAIKEPVVFIAKKELLKWPVYSFWMQEMGCLFLDREDPREAVKVFAEAVRLMKEQGLSVLIYPEGTRSRSSKVNEFHKGSFKLAEKSGNPIVPVMIEGAYHVLEEEGRIKEHNTVHLHYLPAVYLDRMSREEAKNLPVTMRNDIVDEIKKVN